METSKYIPLKFKAGTRDNVKDYLRFLHTHHGYSHQKLLKHFPEYLERAVSRWRTFIGKRMLATDSDF